MGKFNKCTVLDKGKKQIDMPGTSRIYGREIHSGSCWWWDQGGAVGHAVHPFVVQDEGL